MERATPQDAFVSIKYNSLQQLPVGATVGTSSLRRQSQILALRPDLVVTSLRGNVETRLKKLSAGQYDAIILASAGLERLNLTQWIKSQLSASEMLPAVGQEYQSTLLAMEQHFITTSITSYLWCNSFCDTSQTF